MSHQKTAYIRSACICPGTDDERMLNWRRVKGYPDYWVLKCEKCGKKWNSSAKYADALPEGEWET